MAYASAFNPDALPAHVEPDEAAQILARRKDASNPESTSTSPQPMRPTITTPPLQNTPQPDYSSKPQPPLPLSSPAAQHRPGLGSNARPLHSPINSPQPSTTPTSLQHGAPPQRLGTSGFQTPAPQQRRPSGNSRSGDVALYPLFKAVDRQGTGQLSEGELSQALLNGDYTAFDPATVRMMIKMHDHDQDGSINFEEFCALWQFLASWRSLFDKFDEDQSGYISYTEFSNALVQFGYNLTGPFVGMLYGLFDHGNPQGLSFDLFVQSCLTLKRLTDVFKRYDTDRDGYITLSFEDFLTEVLQSR